MSTNIGLQYFPSGVTHLENKKYKEKSLEETTLEEIPPNSPWIPSLKLVQYLSFLLVIYSQMWWRMCRKWWWWASHGGEPPWELWKPLSLSWFGEVDENGVKRGEEFVGLSWKKRQRGVFIVRVSLGTNLGLKRQVCPFQGHGEWLRRVVHSPWSVAMAFF